MVPLPLIRVRDGIHADKIHLFRGRLVPYRIQHLDLFLLLFLPILRGNGRSGMGRSNSDDDLYG
jgi:hypothetical protein